MTDAPVSRDALGDSHNFGRRVTRKGDFVEKPRTVFWEELLLSAKSPLRRALAEAAARDPIGKDALGFLPDLAVTTLPSGIGGRVRRIELAPLPAPSGRVTGGVAVAAGRAIAFFSWFGVADLHWENLALGQAPDGGVVFAPLDVELVLGDFALPTETNLLPAADPELGEVYRHAAGIRRVLPWLGKPVRAETVLALATAYLEMLAFLDRHATALAEAVRRAPGFRRAPIRVSLRGTEEYVRARSEPVFPPLLDAETEQLMRGDVPYFFRTYGRPGIRYYTAPSLRRSDALPSRGDVPRLPPLLSVERGLRSPSRRRLRTEGLLALLAAFDDRALDGTHVAPALRVAFRPRSLVVTLPNGERLSSARNLRAFVGSVYLPCECGEVRTPLVPAVTRCVPGRKGRARLRRRYSPRPS
ncbi:MAG TPA: hypothetical protein VHE30_03035 [Polyangiaceae bacterium]|nr:hypothetical protein [Polyangiaceae bacterium]